MRNLDKGKADIKTFDTVDFVNSLCSMTKGSMYIFCGFNQISDVYRTMVENKLSVRMLIWEKTNPSPMNGDKLWLSGIECCIYGKFPKATFNYHCKNTVFRTPTVRSKLHPTEKPIKLLEYIIQASSNIGDSVFDPCMGSGSTGIACLNTDRKFIGMELDKNYFEIAKERLNNYEPKG